MFPSKLYRGSDVEAVNRQSLSQPAVAQFRGLGREATARHYPSHGPKTFQQHFRKRGRSCRQSGSAGFPVNVELQPGCDCEGRWNLRLARMPGAAHQRNPVLEQGHPAADLP